MKRNYDRIVWFYDRLARLVYGKTLIEAQIYLLEAIPGHARILIVGGGTGWVLEEIAKIHSSGLRITYIDSSAKMIARARQRNVGENKVTFITSSVAELVTDDVYDVVLTPFLFDNFTDSSSRTVFSIIDMHMSGSGIWLYCDFRNTEIYWQRILLKIMYFFFRVSCGIEASRLPDADTCFAAGGYKVNCRKDFMKGFVASIIYGRLQAE